MPKPSTIYLGCNCNKELEDELTQYCRKERIKLVKFEKDNFKYKLVEKITLKPDNPSVIDI